MIQATGRSPVQSVARIALVGVHGFGLHHLHNLARLQALGAVDLVAVADPQPPEAGSVPPSALVYPDLAALLANTPDLDIVIVATPIQTHAPLGILALKSGADLYLEKPPVATLADFHALALAAESAQSSVQIGFQSLGSQALPALQELIAGGELGELLGISATGRWIRDRAYYTRSRWAGKRSINGVDVVDGVATNPLAHAVATALHLAGAHTTADVSRVETDLYRANAIESDDTSVIRISTLSGVTVLCALTLCAEESSEPFVTVHGSQGTATFHYTEDRLDICAGATKTTQTFSREDLTENLLAHRRSGIPLLSPLADSGAFMRVLEAIRTAEDPHLIGSEHVQWEGTGTSAHPVIEGITGILDRATTQQKTFAELGVPWAATKATGAANPHQHRRP